jgi:hypothetical protein
MSSAPTVRAFLQQTLAIEAEGGMLVTSGKRRRTPGGVFFYLVCKNVSPEERKAIFPKTKKKRASRHRPSHSPRSGRPRGMNVKPICANCENVQRERYLREVDPGRPKQVAKAKTCMVCVMEGKAVA